MNSGIRPNQRSQVILLFVEDTLLQGKLNQNYSKYGNAVVVNLKCAHSSGTHGQPDLQQLVFNTDNLPNGFAGHFRILEWPSSRDSHSRTTMHRSCWAPGASVSCLA